jgi:proteasome beta subunit
MNGDRSGAIDGTTDIVGFAPNTRTAAPQRQLSSRPQVRRGKAQPIRKPLKVNLTLGRLLGLARMCSMASDERPEAVKTGTTTLAIACADGVVLATEKRATMGHLIGHKNAQKLYAVDNHMALTTAGLVGDAQMLARHLQAQATLYRLKRDQPMPVRGAATLLGNILNHSKFQPYWVQLILGGYDHRGGSVYSVDAAGGAIEETWTTSGSGSPFVYGVLEDRMEEGVKVKEAIDLAIRGLNAAMRRDAASGNGMDVAVVDGKGFVRLDAAELAKRHKAMKLPLSFNA